MTVDRPLGSAHPRHDWIYPVNYGFVPGTVSGDGEELDAYVLERLTPCEFFEGRCIAVIMRDDDDDPKLVLVPDGVALSDSEILEQTHFQEKYFRARVVRGPG